MRAKPSITDGELIEEVMRRTGIPRRTCLQAIHTHYDVIKQCLESEVEVKISKFGIFSFRDRKPFKDRVYKDFHTGEFKKFSRKGFKDPFFKPNQEWRKRMKRITAWEYDEDGNVKRKADEVEEEDIICDYDDEEEFEE